MQATKKKKKNRSGECFLLCFQIKNRVEVLPKNQFSPGFWKKEKKPAIKARKSAMKAEKEIEMLKESNLALIPCGEKLYFSFIY